MYLSEEKIKESVLQYINNTKIRNAILIDGEWGCGKTYFVEKTLVPFIKDNTSEKKNVIYISLYGISSVEEINKQIWVQTLPTPKKKFNLKKLPGKKVNPIKSLWEVIKIKLPWKKAKPQINKVSAISKSVFLAFLNFKNISFKIDYSKLFDIEKCIFCFDDLERCNMNVNEILGYINNFVEHDGIKTIIIANQNEIGKLNITSNLEMKYYLALQSGSIQFKDKQNIRDVLSNTPNDQKIGPISLDTILSRIEFLFGENILYNQIKEKLIGVTINYKPDILKMVDIFTNDFIKDIELKQSIISSKEFIKSTFEKNGSSNLRTLLFSIDKFEKIGEIILSLDLDRKLEKEILEEIFKYCFALSINIKQGRNVPEWIDDSEYGLRNLDSNVWASDLIFGFKFIDEYLINSFFDETTIIEVIKEYYQEINSLAQDTEDPIMILSRNWWDLEDKQIYQYVEEIEKKLKDDIYNYTVYTTILATYLQLRKLGFEIKIDEALNIMVTNINNIKKPGKDEIDISFEGFGLNVDNSILDEFKSYIERLEINTKKITIKTYGNSINSFFDYKDSWSKLLFEYVKKNNNRLLSKKSFFNLIVVEEVFNCLLLSNNSEIRWFRNAISFVYRFDNLGEFYSSDKNNIEMLKDKLVEYRHGNNTWGLIKKFNIDLLIDQLSFYIEQLSAE